MQYFAIKDDVVSLTCTKAASLKAQSPLTVLALKIMGYMQGQHKQLLLYNFHHSPHDVLKRTVIRLKAPPCLRSLQDFAALSPYVVPNQLMGTQWLGL